jgi:hypothetical protein
MAFRAQLFVGNDRFGARLDTGDRQSSKILTGKLN